MIGLSRGCAPHPALSPLPPPAALAGRGDYTLTVPSPRRVDDGERVRVRGGASYAHVRLDPHRFDAPHYTANETCVTRETTLKGFPTLAIVDLTAKPVLPPTRMRLAAALITWRHPLVPALLRSGFLPSPHRFRFLVNVFDRRIDAKRARWALTWADTDHL